jgi:hypothetical protein
MVFLFTLSLGSVRYLPRSSSSVVSSSAHIHIPFSLPSPQLSTPSLTSHIIFLFENTPLSLPFSYFTTIMFSYLAFIIY